MADLTYAQLKQTWLDNAKDTPYDNNDWASTMAAVASADGTPDAVSAAGVQQLSTQGANSFDSYNSGAYKAFVNTATSPSPPPPGILGRPGQPGSITGGTAGQPSPAEQAAAQSASAATASDCAWSIDPFSFGGILGDLLGHPSWCVLKWSQVRALVAGGILLSGGAVLLFGVSKLLGTSSPADWLKGLGTGAAVAAAPEAAPVIAATRQRPSPPPARPAAQRQRGDASRYDYRRRENAQRLGPNA